MAAEEKTAKEEKPRRRGRGSGTKVAAIRRYLNRHPDAKPREVVAALKRRGIDVTPASVSTIKHQLKTKGLLQPSGAAAGAKAKATPARRGRRPAAAGEITAEALMQAKSLADSLGGVEQAKKALDALAKLQT